MESEFLKQMSELKDKADRYEYQKKRNEELIHAITNIMEKMTALLKEYNPTLKVVDGTKRMKAHSNDDILEWALRWMESGQYLKMDDIEKAFPDRNKGSMGQLFYVDIPKLNKNIQSTKLDGRKALYMLKV
jgi:hypothetical protein